jgi:hypothetical protein
MAADCMDNQPERKANGGDVEKQSSPEESSTLQLPGLELTPSHIAHRDPVDPYFEAGDDIYNRFPHFRKIIITAVLSFCGFLAPISSTTVLSAVPEVAETFNTNGSIINLSNALYLIFMGISPMFWGPMGQIYGRRPVSCTYWRAVKLAFNET